MFESVRVRLTFWYTGLLGVFLVILALATYFIFWQNTVRQTDSDLFELSDAFLTTFRAELADSAEPNDPTQAAREAIIEHRFRDHIFVLLDAPGDVVASSQDLPAKSDAESVPADLLSSNAFRKFAGSTSSSGRIFQNVDGGKHGYRGLARRASVGGESYTLVILRSLHPQKQMLEEVRSTFAAVIPLAILLASLGGYFLARKSLAPVLAMSDQAGRIGAANLHERLPVKNAKDELGHLASSFNKLLERVSESFERQRRFMADASHELRTPAAILRGESEVALSQKTRTAEEYRESLAVLHAEAQWLTHIIEDLFTLTRADAGQYPISPRDFYLEELVAECTHATRTLASAKKIIVAFEPGDELPIRGDEGLLRRMILNLLDNAIKYTPAGGMIAISCELVGNEYALSITDNGPGIPSELQSRVFERFFRADKARTHSEADGVGAGLGLAIARWIAEAHHGRIILTRSDSTGTTFTAFLPGSFAAAPVPVPANR